MASRGTHKSALEAIRSYVLLHGGKCYVMPQSQRLHGSKGIPDLRIHWPPFPVGWRMWWEVKIGHAKLTPEQRIFLAAEGEPNHWGDLDALMDCFEDKTWGQSISTPYNDKEKR